MYIARTTRNNFIRQIFSNKTPLKEIKWSKWIFCGVKNVAHILQAFISWRNAQEQYSYNVRYEDFFHFNTGYWPLESVAVIMNFSIHTIVKIWLNFKTKSLGEFIHQRMFTYKSANASQINDCIWCFHEKLMVKFASICINVFECYCECLFWFFVDAWTMMRFWWVTNSVIANR